MADTGSQMEITSDAIVRAMGIDTNTLLPVKTRVFGATGAELDIIGGVLLHVSPPSPANRPVYSTVRLFYVSRNVSKTYLSLSTLKALHVVDEEFPRIPPAPPSSQTCLPVPTMVWSYPGKSHAPAQSGTSHHPPQHHCPAALRKKTCPSLNSTCLTDTPPRLSTFVRTKPCHCCRTAPH